MKLNDDLCTLVYLYASIYYYNCESFCFYNIHYLCLTCGGWTVWVILVQSSYCCWCKGIWRMWCLEPSIWLPKNWEPYLFDGATARKYCLMCFLELILWYVVYKFLLYSLFKVNMQPIFICGGNWILSDGLLCLSKERYKTDIKFHAYMNLNMIRCWGGGLAEAKILSLLWYLWASDDLSPPPPLLFVCVWCECNQFYGVFTTSRPSNSTGNIETLHGSALDICPWVALRRKFH